MNKVLVFAVSVVAIGLLFSCSSDIESAENILGQGDSSSSLWSSGFSSSSSFLPSGSTFCRYAAGCTEISAEVCIAFGGEVVASCPASSSSSSLFEVLSSSSVSNSSSSLQSGLVFCTNVIGCAEMSAEACSAFGGEVVASCPVGSSSSVVPSSSSSIPPPPSSSSGGSEPSEGADYRIECAGPIDMDCQRKTVNLKVDECVEIAVLNYTDQYYLPNLLMRCGASVDASLSSLSYTLALNEVLYPTNGYTYVSIEVPLGIIKLGNNELGTLCLKSIIGATKVECKLEIAR